MNARLHPYVITFLLSTSVIFSTPAQHTLPVVPEDTVYLELDQWHGELQWQVSQDQVYWTDIAGRTYDSIKYVPVQFPTYLRMKITDGDCDPHFTEVVEVVEAVPPPELPTLTTKEPYAVAVTSAVTGGEITSAGDAPVTARGVVYGTNANPTVDVDMKVASGSGTGSFNALLTGLTAGTRYYVRAYATSSEGTSYGDEYSFLTQVSKVYYISEEGPAGGIVYYDKGSYSDGWRYLEMAPGGWAGQFDPWVDIDWGCDGTFVGGTSTDIGTGKENTDAILANGCAGPGTPVQIATDADINGYDDWFLPSRDELSAIYANLFNLGANFHSTYGFANLTYTSSSELDATGSWGVAFGTGTDVQNSKTGATIAVRPVRRF